MVVTLDIGDIKTFHPKNKQEVGAPCLLAFSKAYTQACLTSYSGPAYWFSRIEGDGIQVYFKKQ